MIDFFHWKWQGDWKFDARYWPDTAGLLIRHDRGVRVAHGLGQPVIRIFFFLRIPDDKRASEVETEYMFGYKYLVAPILAAGQRTRKVYLPSIVRWMSFDESERYEGVKRSGSIA